jgi:hypothetical protein
MARNGGTMADPGSVAYNFARKGVISITKSEGVTEDELYVPVYAFIDSVCQLIPSTGLLAAMRAKTTAEAWKAYGMRLRGGSLLSDDRFGSVITLRFAGACDGLPPPRAMIISIRHSGSLRVLGHKIESKLVKAAIDRALHCLRRESAGRLASSAERDLRTTMLPAVARAVARIARTSGPSLQLAPLVAELLKTRLDDESIPPPDDGEESELAPAAALAHTRALEAALLSALISALDASLAPRKETWRSEPAATRLGRQGRAADSPPPMDASGTDEEPYHDSSVVEEDTEDTADDEAVYEPFDESKYQQDMSLEEKRNATAEFACSEDDSDEFLRSLSGGMRAQPCVGATLCSTAPVRSSAAGAAATAATTAAAANCTTRGGGSAQPLEPRAIPSVVMSPGSTTSSSEEDKDSGGGGWFL